MRVVSDILESTAPAPRRRCAEHAGADGCGVPIKAPVAGIAMGMVKEGPKYAILTDIAGAEDHYVTWISRWPALVKGLPPANDIKVPNVTTTLMEEALEQAAAAACSFGQDPGAHLRPAGIDVPYAPRIYTLTFRPTRSAS